MIHTESDIHDVAGRDASIRQIALLLNALPERTHRVLLGQLNGDSKKRVAAELSSLGEIDPLEQHRVLNRMHDALQSETSTVESVESEIQDEIQIGKARVSKKRSGAVYHPGDSASDSPDARPTPSINQEAQDATQGQRLRAEHPEPDRHEAPATLPYATQTDVVTGQAAVTPPPEILQSMFAQFRQTQAAGVLPSVPSQDAQRHGTTTTPHAARDFPANLHEDHGPESVVGLNRGGASDGFPFDAQELAERVDRFLCDLPPEQLCQALGMVTTKEAFLVLCGLPNEIAETVLDMLPRRKARKVRGDMRKMGRLQLSEIDAAKNSVAQIALKLIARPNAMAA